MQLTKVISSYKNNIAQRLIKVLRFGRSDNHNSYQALPHGIDSVPVKDMIAVYGSTNTKGDSVIIGYLSRDVIAEVGELRLYSTDSGGAEQVYIHLTNTGNMELNGNFDNAVRYNPLEQGLTNQNTQILAELAKISAAIAGVGGSYTVGTVQIDISAAKINEIKTS